MVGNLGNVFLWKGSTLLGGCVFLISATVYPKKNLEFAWFNLTIYCDLFKGMFYFVPWDSSLLFTTMWEDMFTFFQASKIRKSKYIIFFHMGVGKDNPSTQTPLLPTARSFKTGEAPGSSSASKKRKKGALIRSFYQFHVPCVKLLMVQKSGDHQLRLVVEIPLFTRFYASQVMQVPWTIRVISEKRTQNLSK